MSEPDPEQILRQLDKLLASDQLARADTSRRLLSYLVDCRLRGEIPKETSIALDVFAKDVTFSGAEHSIVRVSARTLRQKLIEYYGTTGACDEVRFDVPKGGYKLVVSQPTPAAIETAPSGKRSSNGWRVATVVTGAAFALMALANFMWIGPSTKPVPTRDAVRDSVLWSDIAKSKRRLTIVLGDLFMYTHVDQLTGRTLTVRDPGINSNDELRLQLASDPKFAAGRGERYTTMLQKTVVLSMMAVLGVIDATDRSIEVVARDDVTADAIRQNDIIYLGPLVRLGPLVGHYELQSRYHYNNAPASITDIITGRAYLPAGDLGDKHVDYALAAKFMGPTGNNILIVTSGARNAGILQIVRTLTSAAGLEKLATRLRTQPKNAAGSFEALLTVTGFKRTDLAAEIVEVSALPRPATQPPAVAP